MDAPVNKKMLRINAVRNASDEILALYSNPELGDVLFQITEELCMNEERKILFTHAVGDIILGTLSQKEFVAVITSELGISSEKALSIEKSLESFFRKAFAVRSQTTQIPQANNEFKEKLELRPEVARAPVHPAPQPAVQGETATGIRPLTREEVLHALAPKRTMQSDIATLTQQSDATEKTPRWVSEH